MCDGEATSRFGLDYCPECERVVEGQGWTYEATDDEIERKDNEVTKD